MLPVVETLELRFPDVASALEHHARRTRDFRLVPPQSLEVTPEGALNIWAGGAVVEEELPLTDVALGHLESIAHLPAAYAARIRPELHVKNLNEQLASRVGELTVVIEEEPQGESSRRLAAAVVPGGLYGVDHAVILNHLLRRSLPAVVRYTSGTVAVEFGHPVAVEVLAGDVIEVRGYLKNERWGPRRPTPAAALECAVHLLRLVCTNGAIAARTLASGSVLRHALDWELERRVERCFDAVAALRAETLTQAVAAMVERVPEELEARSIQHRLARVLGPEEAERLAAAARTYWDYFNLVTAAANTVTGGRRQTLQVWGGEILDRHLELAA